MKKILFKTLVYYISLNLDLKKWLMNIVDEYVIEDSTFTWKINLTFLKIYFNIPEDHWYEVMF